MKRMFILVMTLSILVMMSVTASARSWNNDQHKEKDKQRHQKHRYHDDSNWRHSRHADYESEKQLPFKWHDRYDSMRERHHMVRIYDRDWDRRFPGAHAYRWSGEGFWHQGRYVNDAVLFFDDDNVLISIGYMSDGVFIHVREDHEVYENHDSFFLAFWRR